MYEQYLFSQYSDDGKNITYIILASFVCSCDTLSNGIITVQTPLDRIPTNNPKHSKKRQNLRKQFSNSTPPSKYLSVFLKASHALNKRNVLINVAND